MPDRRRRRNDEIRHEVNERIADVAAGLGAAEGDSYEFFCECSRLDCHEAIRLTLAEYQALEAGSRRLIAPDHYDASLGTVEAVGRGVVVIAESTSPP